MKTWIPWVGRIISVAPVCICLWSAYSKLTASPWYVSEWLRIGWPLAVLPVIGLVQVACVTLYVIPQTALLGMVLLTGYLGGAMASYVRMGETTPMLVSMTTSLLAWLGLYLRDERLRALLPFRRRQTT